MFGPVSEGFGPRKGFQKVGEAYSKILAKDGLRALKFKSFCEASIFASVLEGSGPQKGFQKVGEAYSKILAKDGLERRSGRWFSGKVDLWGHVLVSKCKELGSGSVKFGIDDF